MIGYALLQAAISILTLCLGYLFGRVHQRLGRSASTVGQPKPICMCTHFYGSHEHGHKCGATIRDDVYGFKLGNCACLIYLGPDPLLSGLWSPSTEEKVR